MSRNTPKETPVSAQSGINVFDVTGREPLVIPVGEPNVGGAYTEYVFIDRDTGWEVGRLRFQSQPTHKGLDGVLGISLLEVVNHRLACFQTGRFKSRENALMQQKIQEGAFWTMERTRERARRGVQDTQKK